jgi:TolA-binding protein
MTTKHRSGWKKFAGLKLALGALTVFQSSFILAQTPEATKPTEAAKPTSEVEQLKQRLQQLEQTVVELKGQINAIEETKKQSPAPAIVQATYSDSGTPVVAAPAAAPNPQDSKGESSFQIYGFAMFDAGYQFKQADPNWFDTVRPQLPAARPVRA